MQEKYDITGMSCAACSARVEKEVSRLSGISSCQVNLLTNSMSIEYDEELLSSEQVIAAVEGAGYGASLKSAEGRGARGKEREKVDRNASQKQMLAEMKSRLQWSMVFLLILMYITMGTMVGLPLPILNEDQNSAAFALTQLLLVLPVMYLNRKYYIQGFKALFHRSPNMDSLIAVGSGAAFVHGIAYLYGMIFLTAQGNIAAALHHKHNLYFESISMILTLITLGKYFETKAKSKTTEAIGKLLDLAPKRATILVDGEEKEIDTEDVQKGDILVIRPGESIPVDGMIIEGSTNVDESAITGESIPVARTLGDKLIGATINKNGFVKMKATQVGEDTTIAQIIALVEEASSSKAPIAKLADRVSGVFVPIVMGISLLTFVVWMLLGQDLSFALSNAIAVLVISCPCALGLATPVAIMVSTGKAAELGILIKSADALETTHALDTVILDKTGTVTEGKPRVTDILVYREFVKNETDQSTEENIRFISSNSNLQNKIEKTQLIAEDRNVDPMISQDRTALLQLAASIESASEHPLADAILHEAKEWGIDLLAVRDFDAEPGSGISARVEYGDGNHSETIYAGNAKMLNELSKKGILKVKESAMAFIKLGNAYALQGKTPLYFVMDGIVLGVIAVADTIKKDSSKAVHELTKKGIEVILLTGDNAQTAAAIAEQAGITKVIAEVLPQDKESKVRELMESGKKVAMVGDGINDAPALARANVGIAIGAGTDIAIESADIVLMHSSLMDVVRAIDLSKATIRKIKQNLFWAFFYNCIGIPLAAGVFYFNLGWTLSPMFGAAAMSLSSICVVSNALLLKRFKGAKSVGRNAESLPVKAEILESGREEKEEKEMEKTVLQIEGMMCAHCQANVEKTIAKFEGVVSVEANPEEKNAVIQADRPLDLEGIKKAIAEAGYEVK